MHISVSDLEDYKKILEQQLRDADKKLAENLSAIQLLNRDKERRDKEISDLEAAAREVIETIDLPQPPTVSADYISKWLQQF